jgi:hypothetical protein
MASLACGDRDPRGLRLAAGRAAGSADRDAMLAAAERLLASFPAEQRARVQLAFEGKERTDWHYVPRQRAGVALRDMTDEQRRLAHALLRTGLSSRGYLKATSIMALEGVLRDLENARGSDGAWRDPENYAFRGVRHAVLVCAVGLAYRGPSPLAAVRVDHQRAARRDAGVLRREPGRGEERSPRGPARARARGGSPVASSSCRSMRRSAGAR